MDQSTKHMTKLLTVSHKTAVISETQVLAHRELECEVGDIYSTWLNDR